MRPTPQSGLAGSRMAARHHVRCIAPRHTSWPCPPARMGTLLLWCGCLAGTGLCVLLMFGDRLDACAMQLGSGLSVSPEYGCGSRALGILADEHRPAQDRLLRCSLSALQPYPSRDDIVRRLQVVPGCTTPNLHPLYVAATLYGESSPGRGMVVYSAVPRGMPVANMGGLGICHIVY